jgi:hypothetical protein
MTAPLGKSAFNDSTNCVNKKTNKVIFIIFKATESPCCFLQLQAASPCG